MRAADIIVDAVATAFRITPDDITGKRRLSHFTEPRFAACWLLREMIAPDGRQRSYPAIGRVLGGRDHSTMIYAYARAGELMARDPEYADSVAEARAVAQSQEWHRARPKVAPAPEPTPPPPEPPVKAVALKTDESPDGGHRFHDGIAAGSRRLAAAIARARAA